MANKFIEKLVPDYLFRSAAQATPKWLKERGFKAVASDLDNTLTAIDKNDIDENILKWIISLDEHGIPLIIYSNNDEKRVESFVSALPVKIKYVSKAKKPDTRGFLKLVMDLGIRLDEVLFIGDKLHTDIYGANSAGIPSALVPPYKMGPIVFARHLLERPFIAIARERSGMKRK